ncbi:hypothetical protein P20495_3764 [Pseudoalteromonas sp. BSi20495]|nr:hypothetical protein P20495_3764 [Pseudoalteromonas sp. BSi20495]
MKRGLNRVSVTPIKSKQLNKRSFTSLRIPTLIGQTYRLLVFGF